MCRGSSRAYFYIAPPLLFTLCTIRVYSFARVKRVSLSHLQPLSLTYPLASALPRIEGTNRFVSGKEPLCRRTHFSIIKLYVLQLFSHLCASCFAFACFEQMENVCDCIFSIYIGFRNTELILEIDKKIRR